MEKKLHKPAPEAVFAIIGATGTGKSTFIRLLTNDHTIHTNHNQDSGALKIQSVNYIDGATGCQVMLVDTPGFNNSRKGITDTVILQKIIEYLEPEKGKGRKLSGIIYMHRISDPQVGGVSRKNLRMFHSLCGEKTLGNVCIVTTNWDRVTVEVGCAREADLMNGFFKPLIDAGAQMRRHANTAESAFQIMSELIPFKPVATTIQEEMQAEIPLGEAGAGGVLTAEMQELKKRHKSEMVDLKKEMEAAAQERGQELRTESELERKAIEEKIKGLHGDQAKLERTVEEQHGEERKGGAEEEDPVGRRIAQWHTERRKFSAEGAAARENATRVRLWNDVAKRRSELERPIAEADKKVAALKKMIEEQHEAERRRIAEDKAHLEQQMGQWADERCTLSAAVVAARENAMQLGDGAAKRQIAEANRKVAELEQMIEEQHEAEQKRRAEEMAYLDQQMSQWADERHELLAEVTAAREIATRLGNDAVKRQSEFEQQIAEANGRAAESATHKTKLARTLEEQREAERKRRAEEKAYLDQQMGQWADERRNLLAEVAATRGIMARVRNDAAKRQSEFEWQIAEANRRAAEMAARKTMLEKVVEEQCEAEEKRRAEEKTQLERRTDQWDDEHRKLSAEVAAAHENTTRLAEDSAKKQRELERQIAVANRKAAELEKMVEEQREADQRQRAEEKAHLEQQMCQWADERHKLSAEATAAHENATRLGADAAKRQGELERQIAEAKRQHKAERKQRAEEMAHLERQMSQRANEHRKLSAGLGSDAAKRQGELEQQIVEANKKAAKLEKMVEEQREAERQRRAEEKAHLEQQIGQWVDEHHKLSGEVAAACEDARRLANNAVMTQAELERQLTEAKMQHEAERKQEEAHLERQMGQWASERRKLSAEVTIARENATLELGNDAAKRRWLEQEIAETNRRRTEERAHLEQQTDQWVDERRKLYAEVTAARENATRLGNEAAKRQSELERQIAEANRQHEAERKKVAEGKAYLEQQMGQWAGERRALLAEVAAARESMVRLRNDTAQRQRGLEQQIAEANRNAAELERTVEEQREVERKRRAEEKAHLELRMGQWARERRSLSAEIAAARENATRPRSNAAERQGELERQIAEAHRQAADMAVRETQLKRMIEEQRETERKRSAEERVVHVASPNDQAHISGPSSTMANEPRKSASKVVFVIMGATGTGKSTFIHLLTDDDMIRIGHNQNSETFEIQTADYIDRATGRQVMLIDTPGFDDSREGITDTDILQKIVEYLEPEKGKSRKLNGIIYMHRISDPRVGGASRKNLRMFHSLCGKKALGNVRIVTTNWNRVTEEEGRYRETDLMNGAFKPLIDAGAQMRRHMNTVESASHIMSELFPLKPVITAIQEEVQAGMTLAQTSTGRVLTAEMQELQKKHEREIADLKKEMEAAVKERDQELLAELELERKAVEEKIKCVEGNRAKLERTVEEQREAERKGRAEEKAGCRP